ncbi:hypothetical protein ACM25N_17460 [Roseovarius sp. C7]|uniref:hypothetical protein n=1 Tax=Roseovarius sp. C7 TaxID=3398643 RepID=UPI0039F6A954
MTDRKDRTDRAQGAADEAGLELFFDAARAQRPVPGEDLMARVLTDAAALQPRQGAARDPLWARLVARWDGLRRDMGGWPAMAGLATAAVTGIWVGSVAPEAINGYWSGESEAYVFDVMAGDAYASLEGAF